MVFLKSGQVALEGGVVGEDVLAGLVLRSDSTMFVLQSTGFANLDLYLSKNIQQ